MRVDAAVDVADLEQPAFDAENRVTATAVAEHAIDATGRGAGALGTRHREQPCGERESDDGEVEEAARHRRGRYPAPRSGSLRTA